VPLSTVEQLEPALNAFWPTFRAEIAGAILRRFGLAAESEEKDADFVTALFAFLMESQAPYEQTFFDWYGGRLSEARAAKSPSADHYASVAFAPFRELLLARQPQPGLRLDHPYFARRIARSMLIDEMEALWAPIATKDDWEPLHAALGEIEQMRQAYAA